MLQSLFSCWGDLASRRDRRSAGTTGPPPVQDQSWQEDLDQMINEVLLTEIGKLRATFSHHLREYEVTLSQMQSENGNGWARQDIELLRHQVHLMERQKRRRNLEVGKLRKAMKEVRNALFTETPPAAQGHVAAQQLLEEVRVERERRTAEKQYLEDQIKKLQAEIEEQQNAPADHEKEKLKASVKQLKTSIESKDRYACWVCNRAHERHEESDRGSVSGEDSDHHEDECVMMRRRLLELEEELREISGDAVTGQPSAASDAPAEAASSNRRPGARLSLEPPSVSEAPMNPASSLMRSARDRVPTPWASQAAATFESEALVQFSDSVTTVTSPEVPETVPEVGNRSVRDRIATPYVDASAASNEDRRVVLAPVLSSIEEFEAESSREQLRSSRDRMPTPHVSSQMVEETFANSAKTVRIFPAADVEAIPVSGEGRSTRERIATPFMKDDEPFEDARSVHFSTEVSRRGESRPSFGAVEEIETEVAAEQHLRNTRERIPTPHVRMDMIEDSPTDSDRHVRISLAAHVEAVPLTGERRPSRDRIPTPFFKETLPVEERSTVQFHDSNEVTHQTSFGNTEEIQTEVPAENMMRRTRERIATPHVRLDLMEEPPAADTAKHVRVSNTADIEVVPAVGQRRTSRDRIPTPFVKEEIMQFDDSRGVQFNDTVTTEVLPSSADTEPLRSSRERIPTPHVSLEMIEDAFNASAKKVRIFPAADVEALPVSGGRRPSRDRIPTPFIKEDVVEEPQERPQATSFGGTEEYEVETSDPTSQRRPSRDRIPTPFVNAELLQESHKDSAKCVRIVPSADVEAIPVSGDPRPCRDRISTPFLKDLHEEGRAVHFDDAVSTEDVPTNGERRPSRSRRATPFFGGIEVDGMESGDSEDSSKWGLSLDFAEGETRTVGFQQHSDADVVVITPVGEMRPVKRRGAKAGASARDRSSSDEGQKRTVNFQAPETFRVSAQDASRGEGCEQVRSSRDRVATPFLTFPEEDRPELHVVIAAKTQVEEVEAATEKMRSSRDRIPTPFVSSELVQEAFSSSSKKVHIFPAADVEAIPLKGEARTIRDRIATPFIEGDEFGDGDRSVQFTDQVSGPVQHAITFGKDQAVFLEVEADHMRSSRNRIPTPHVSSELVQEAFTDSAKKVHIFPAADVEAIPVSGEARTTRDRIATPFVKDDCFDDRPGVIFHDDVSTEVSSKGRSAAPSFGGSEEFEVEASKENLRASRDRVPTPHVSAELIEETFAGFAKSVRVLPTADVQAIHLTAEPRSSRDRIATPFMKEDVLDEGHVHFNPERAEVPPISGLHPFGAEVGSRSVHDRLPTPFASAREFQEDGRVAINAFGKVQEFEVDDPKNHLRSSRDRVPTPHVSNELIEETFAGFQKSVRVLPTADIEAIPVAKDARSSRDRIATPFVKEDAFGDRAVNFEDDANATDRAGRNETEAPDSRTVSFRPNNSLIEFDNISPVSDEAVVSRRGAPWKSVRERQQTGWVEDRKVKFKDASPDSNQGNHRTAGQSGHPEDETSARSRGGSDPDDPPSDAESISASSASSRNPRSRMSTPFMSAVDWGYDVSVPSAQASATPESVSSSSGRRRRSKPSTLEPCSSSTDRNLVKQVSIESSIEREISERVKLNAQRQAREERLVRVGSTDANVPLALERCSSADGGNPEADLANHIVEDEVKDTEMVIRTLRNLVFFETFDDEALHSLIEAMEVYEFQNGEKVVRQGDTDGTHFFVVAQGEFCVLKDNVAHCYIGPGQSFGESVLLLFGERNATVCARGCARAYGMEGMQVRELLSAQYEQRRLSIVDAMDEVLKSNVCEVLSGLNGYQLQSLYDQVEMKTFEAGDVILKEGETTKEVLILYSGEVQSWSRDQKMDNIGRCHLMGDRALVQDELSFQQPTTLKAETAVEVLVLKHTLLDNIFGDQLPQVLVKHRVLYVLAKHQDFSRLHQEHREAVASSCQIRCLPKGSEHSWEDVRVMVALNGEVDLTLDEIGMQHLTGASPTMFSIPYNDQLAPLKVKALADSKLAVWQREDLGSILAFDNFDGAVEQDSKVRSLQSVFIFATLSMEQLKRLAAALEIETVKTGARVFSQGDQGTHFYIIRKGVVSVQIDGREKRRLGAPDYFGDRALLGSEIRSASIAALEDTELWKMGKETFQEMMQGPCLDYLKDRISLQDTNLTFSDLEYVRVIGRGGFGIVKMVRAKKTGVRYALKCVRKRDVVEKNVQDALVSELSILKEVDHPFIIKFVRSFRNESRVYFLMELVSGGELLDALDSIGLLKYSQALFYTGSIVLALEFLHARRIAYLDLKSENCLIDQQGYLKIIDFGIARRITNTRYGPLKGTPMFMAPEMILGKGHTTVADLWSLGICLYEFVIGNFPFANNCSNHGAIFHEILRADLKFPQWFDKQPMADDIMSLIRGLLTRDPKKRLGAGHEGYTKLKKHAFFRDLCWEKLLGRELEPPFVPKSETYAEDKEKPTLPAADDYLPTVEEEEADRKSVV